MTRPLPMLPTRDAIRWHINWHVREGKEQPEMALVRNVVATARGFAGVSWNPCDTGIGATGEWDRDLYQLVRQVVRAMRLDGKLTRRRALPDRYYLVKRAGGAS